MASSLENYMTMPGAEEEEELEDLPQAEKEADPWNNMKIVREVEGQVFRGFVEDIEQGKITKDRLYRVRYEDGDLEHFSAEQVEMYQDRDAIEKKPAAAVSKRPASSDEAAGEEEGEEANMDVDGENGEDGEEGQEEEEEEAQGTAVAKKPAAGESAAKKPAAADEEEADVEDEEGDNEQDADEEEEQEQEKEAEGDEEEEQEEEEVTVVKKKPAAGVGAQKAITKGSAKAKAKGKAKAQGKAKASTKAVLKKPAKR